MTRAYSLTAAAEDDIRGIIRYTRRHWGDAQVRDYMHRLERGIERVAAGQGHFKEVSTLYPELRMAHCEHHFIFCLPRDDAPALIVAIFHERMDLMAHLVDRLT
ncbi:type II toxin-antitoxin system RelE/ParE family toxin [Flavisphingomonas formosensis]|uniref:type II toxin-antitoxin system RelE/ParE family toxin n=1 Tax=Flavisphingomonas formosensis TaxID=861534 RepID=UPI0012FB0673|nr:type II toxin-antitoxin system RelE/ParE family toxin [Sphingomonas formosensis]